METREIKYKTKVKVIGGFFNGCSGVAIDGNSYQEHIPPANYGNSYQEHIPPANYGNSYQEHIPPANYGNSLATSNVWTTKEHKKYLVKGKDFKARIAEGLLSSTK